MAQCKFEYRYPRGTITYRCIEDEGHAGDHKILVKDGETKSISNTVAKDFLRAQSAARALVASNGLNPRLSDIPDWLVSRAALVELLDALQIEE